MDGLLNLGLNNGEKKILNAENGLTFCIEIGEKNKCDINSFCSVESKEEPSISVIEHLVENDNVSEFASHEIIDGLTQPSFTKPVEQQINFSKPPEIKYSIICNKDSNKPEIQNKKRKRINKKSQICPYSKKLKSNDMTTLILKNLKEHKNKKCSSIKFMYDPKKSLCVFNEDNSKTKFQSEVKCGSKILEDSKDSLFVLNKLYSGNSKSSLNSSTSISESSNLSENSESNNIERPALHLIKDTKGEFRHHPVFIASNKSKTIYWEEGNIDRVKDFVSLSQSIIDYYSISKEVEKQTLDVDYSQFLPNVLIYESPLGNKLGVAPGVNLSLSWEAVKNRIEELQEQTMTRFISVYKTPTFKDEPKPFKKLYFEMNIQRKEMEIIIPNNGIPFVYLGHCIYTCHLGKNRLKKKNLKEDLNGRLKSKKIGCPASLSISRIARFPDFDVSNLNKACEDAVLKELRDFWDFSNSRVRYYIEYHIREPQADDHKGHEVMFLVNNNRFRESVDPRIIKKIHELTRQGVFKAKPIRERLNQFIQDDLFKGQQIPSQDRRRYNPSERDIRYEVLKAKEELKKEGKNILQLECSALTEEISDSLKNISENEYLKEIKYYLALIHKAVRLKQPLQAIFLSTSVSYNGITQSSPLKKTLRDTSNETEDDCPIPFTDGIANTATAASTTDFLSSVPSSSAGVHFPDQVIEHFYVNSGDDAPENVFNAQIYGSQDLVDLNPSLIEGLHSSGEDEVTKVYYYFSEGGTCQMVAPEALANDSLKYASI